MAEARRMGKTELFTHFAERFGIKRTEAGEFVLPGVAKLVVQQRERRIGHKPATGATVEIPAKQVVKARIAKQFRDVLEA